MCSQYKGAAHFIAYTVNLQQSFNRITETRSQLQSAADMTIASDTVKIDKPRNIALQDASQVFNIWMKNDDDKISMLNNAYQNRNPVIINNTQSVKSR
jgi:hypothetical protein